MMLALNQWNTDTGHLKDSIISLDELENNPPSTGNSPEDFTSYYTELFTTSFYISMALYRAQIDDSTVKEYLKAAARNGFFMHNVRVINQLNDGPYITWDYLRAFALNVCWGRQEVVNSLASFDEEYYYPVKSSQAYDLQRKFAGLLKNYVILSSVDLERCAACRNMSLASEIQFDRNVLAPAFSSLAALGERNFDRFAQQISSATSLYKAVCMEGEFQLAPDGCMALLLMMLVKLAPIEVRSHIDASPYLPLTLL